MFWKFTRNLRKSNGCIDAVLRHRTPYRSIWRNRVFSLHEQSKTPNDGMPRKLSRMEKISQFCLPAWPWGILTVMWSCVCGFLYLRECARLLRIYEISTEKVDYARTIGTYYLDLPVYWFLFREICKTWTTATRLNENESTKSDKHGIDIARLTLKSSVFWIVDIQMKISVEVGS